MKTRLWRSRPSAYLVALLVLVGSSCTGAGEQPAARGSAGPSVMAAIPTPVPDPAATPSPAQPPALQVSGVFTEPRLRAPDAVRALRPPPPSGFQPWNGTSTVLYDTRTGVELDLGEGSRGVFSPDGRTMAWRSGTLSEWQVHQVWTLDLASGARRTLGPGWALGFVSNEDLLIREANGNRRELVNIVTGQRSSGDGIRFPDFDRTTTPEGHVLQRTQLEDYPFLRSGYVLREAATGRPLLEFEAYRALPAEAGKLVVATPPREGTTNIFMVDIATGRAEFVATSSYTPPNWPLAATGRYVLWTDRYCDYPNRGKTRLHDRLTGKLTELDATLWAAFTPGGLIAAGEFGARVLVDPETLEYQAVLPDRAAGAPTGSASEVSWSPDYRYASHGYAGGHGGLC